MTASHTHHLAAPGRLSSSAGRALVLALCAVDAGLMVASGLIHLHLWNIAYRHVTIGHLDVLFLIQAIASLVGAAAVVVIRRLIVVAGCAALMAGTIVGYLIARYRSGGLLGFRLTFSTSDASWALAVEIAAVVVLALTGAVLARRPSAT